MADPTPAELLIRIEHLTGQLGTTVAAVDRLRSTMEHSYVPRGEYNAQRQAITDRLKQVEADIEDQVKHRRQTWTAIGLAFLAAFAGVIANLFTGGAPT